MRTDDLITLLSQTPPRRPPLRLSLAVVVAIAVTMVVNTLVLGLRPDIAMPPLSMAYKSVVLLTLAVIAGGILARVARPVATAGQGVIAAVLFALLVAGSLGWEWSHAAPTAILHSFVLPNFPFCLGAVTIYGAAAAGALTGLMRFYAPADERRAAAAIGFAAAAAGAVGYSIHCPIDSPSFVVVAYGLPIAWVTLASRMLLVRLIRW
ncbi:NrsF family protein [Rhizomicrobium electricum]|uniref:DUF1109 domain-containing protein n=1 Tax=Rhizomicrobium electricum TaxID=480070 RepID=A0ABN1F7E7_9PROT|nr:DUF1109 domain-containing protein [Rhizomicrobium electricum]NIJ46665.1 hypothetical protein [Rhizomicrobium electricum]